MVEFELPDLGSDHLQHAMHLGLGLIGFEFESSFEFESFEYLRFEYCTVSVSWHLAV